MKKYFTVFVFFTLISRILGLIRDILISYRLGASILSDIFFVAFRFPNLFRSIFAEGAFSSAFLPLYTNISNNSGEKDSLHFAHNIQTILLFFLVIITILIEIFTGEILRIIAPGLFARADASLIISTSRIIFPYIIFISMASLYSGILQSLKKFGATSFSPVILNICLITSLIINTNSSAERLNYMAISVIIAGLMQLIYCILLLQLNDINVFKFKFNFDGKVKKFFKRFIPAILSAEIYQINIFVDTFFASSIMYGISYLYYADRIVQLPLALIGIALGTITLPLITEAITKKNIEHAIEIQNKALEIAITLAIPAAVGLFILSEQIIETLFSLGGNFTENAVTQTSQALKVFTFALPAYIFNKIFLSVFFANGDTKTPLKFAAINLFLNIILNIILAPHYQHVGIAIASVISGWSNLFMLIISLRKKSLYKPNKSVRKTITYSFFASSIMLITLDITTNYLLQTGLHSYIEKILTLLILCVTGLLTFFTTLNIIKKLI